MLMEYTRRAVTRAPLPLSPRRLSRPPAAWPPWHRKRGTARRNRRSSSRRCGSRTAGGDVLERFAQRAQRFRIAFDEQVGRQTHGRGRDGKQEQHEPPRLARGRGERSLGEPEADGADRLALEADRRLELERGAVGSLLAHDGQVLLARRDGRARRLRQRLPDAPGRARHARHAVAIADGQAAQLECARDVLHEHVDADPVLGERVRRALRGNQLGERRAMLHRLVEHGLILPVHDVRRHERHRHRDHGGHPEGEPQLQRDARPALAVDLALGGHLARHLLQRVDELLPGLEATFGRLAGHRMTMRRSPPGTSGRSSPTDRGSSCAMR